MFDQLTKEIEIAQTELTEVTTKNGLLRSQVEKLLKENQELRLAKVEAEIVFKQLGEQERAQLTTTAAQLETKLVAANVKVAMLEQAVNTAGDIIDIKALIEKQYQLLTAKLPEIKFDLGALVAKPQGNPGVQGKTAEKGN